MHRTTVQTLAHAVLVETHVTDQKVAAIKVTMRCILDRLRALRHLIASLSILTTAWDDCPSAAHVELADTRAQWQSVYACSLASAQAQITTTTAWIAADRAAAFPPTLARLAHTELQNAATDFVSRLEAERSVWATQQPAYCAGVRLHTQNAQKMFDCWSGHADTSTVDQLRRLRLAREMLDTLLAAKGVLQRQLAIEPTVKTVPAFSDEWDWIQAEWKTTFRLVDDVRKKIEAECAVATDQERTEMREIEAQIERQRIAFHHPSA